ncbi:MAG TPA: SdrD B-like domain-containing protein [Pirellulales bacterium]|nr:SdrD B-like domain-containing protein [Pirellulales bacterium]
MSRWRRRLAGSHKSAGPHASPWRRCQVEQLEPRQMMAADLQLGAVYFEPADGTDSTGNTFTVTWSGGAAGTTLSTLTIDLDKNGNNAIDDGEGFFDTAAGGAGVYGYMPFTLLTHTGFDVTGSTVVDGGQKLVLTFNNFTVGDSLTFKIDVDEAGHDGNGSPSVSAFDEGREFQGSKLSGTFTNPNYYDASGTGVFVDAYDSQLSASGLPLPPDNYMPPSPVDLTVQTAGTMFPLTQTPLPSSIAGNVSVATNAAWNNPSATLAPIPSVTVNLLNSSNVLVATTTTDAHGNYEFDGLNPGNYHVVEVQPNGYLEGGDKVGSLGGNTNGVDELDNIVLVANDHGLNYNFIEQLPSTVSGNVVVVTNGDCDDPNATQSPIANVTLQLFDSSGHAVLDGSGHAITTVTDSHGHYSFTGLNPGTYSVHEVIPAGYLEGCDYVGTVNGAPVGNKPDGNDLTNIALASGQNGVNYNFHLLLPVSISGKVQEEVFGNCDNPANTFTPLAGVTVALVDSHGVSVTDGSGHAITTTTAADGTYSFTALPPGTYGVHIVVPNGLYAGSSSLGTVNGVVDGVATSAIALDDSLMWSGQNGIHYDFVVLPPPNISGRVVYDVDGNCETNPNEPPVANVTVNLLNSSGQVVATTLTDTNGYYTFKAVAPGTYSVQEVIPADWMEDDAHAGCNGGVVINPHTITLVSLNPGDNTVHYNFCLVLPVSIAGNVELETHGNCDDPANTFAPLAGVTVVLVDGSGNAVLGSNGQEITTTTDSNGNYAFTHLPQGTYGAHIVVPNGLYDGYSSVGTVNGVVDGLQTSAIALDDAVLTTGQNGIDYDFVLLPPPNISGRVMIDVDGHCDTNPNEPGLGGVRIDLLDVSGAIVATTFTDSGGNYTFKGIAPNSNYTIRETVPGGYFEEDAHLGCNGGYVVDPHTMTLIGVQPGDNPVHYNFCLNVSAVISGYAYQDGADLTTAGNSTSLADVPSAMLAQHDGRHTSDDTPIAGVVVYLADANGNLLHDANGNVISTVTDATGFYRFTGITPGVYTVIEGGASGYYQWINTPGSTGGTAAYRGNTIASITIANGQSSVENDFSFVRVTPLPFFFVSNNALPTPPAGSPYLPSAPPIVPQQQVLAPLPYGKYVTSGGADGYTWHLSVVNAGLPRATGPDGEAIVQLVGQSSGLEVWADSLVATSRWKLRTVEDDDQVSVTELVFGINGALPVTGDYNGDGRTDIGVFVDGQWLIDLNGNGAWDKDDLWAKLGYADDLPATGDWDGDAKTDIAIYGKAWPGDPNHIRYDPGLPNPDNRLLAQRERNVPPKPHMATYGVRAMQRTSGGKVRSDLIDHVFNYGAPGDRPVAGNFNGSGVDTIGVFRDGVWHLDQDGDGRFTKSDGSFTLGQAGDLPVVGDFNGDGVDELGVYRQGKWLIDINGDRQLDDRDMTVEFGGPLDLPVVGDWNGDGRDDLGVYTDGAVADQGADGNIAQADDGTATR